MLVVIVIVLCVNLGSGYHDKWLRGSCNTSAHNLPFSSGQQRNEVCGDSVLRASSFNGNIFSQLSGFSELHQNLKANVSGRCAAALMDYRRNLINGEMSALKMYDANAKLSSGVLKGNLNQFGDFDECMELEEAQYCLLELDFTNFWRSIDNSKFENLVHSDYILRGTFTDPAHRVPNFSLVKWGLCLPDQCDRKEIVEMAEEGRSEEFRVQLREQLCQRKSAKEGTSSGMRALTASIFGSLAVIVMTSSLTPRAGFGESKWYLLFKSFSLQTNLPQLLKTHPTTLKSVHGIRALSALALFMCHKAITQLFGPYTNTSALSDNMSHPWRIIGRTAFIYTDSFIILSGFLTARSFIAQLEQNNDLGIRNRITRRLFRILPNFLVTILFCTYILPHLGTGPLWPLLVNEHSNLCKKYMWKNLLFVHNYFGFENMCLTHTHQLAIDMQLFLFSPVIVWTIFHRRKLGYCLAAILSFISCLVRAGAILKWRLSYVVYFGIPISKMFDTANYSYILPTHRAAVYIMGICLAFVLMDGVGATFRKVKHASSIYILVSISLGFYATAGPHWMTAKSYKYNVGEAIAFGVLSPILWSLAIWWTIHATKYSYGGWLVRLLEWDGFQFFSKISYSFYLVQFPVFFYNVAKRRYSSEYDPYTLIESTETLVILFLSVILTLAVEIPFQNIHNIIFKSTVIKKKCI